MRWVVRAGDGGTVREILVLAGADAGALREGRVFLGRRRLKEGSQPVVPGDEVNVVSPRQTDGLRASILVRTVDLVAVDKPAGVPTIADHGGSSNALTALVERAIGVESGHLHPTSRLDRDVSGVVIFALTKDAAKRLAVARSRGTYERRYVAIASQAPASVGRGTWSAPIGRARDPRLRAINGRDPVPATTRFALCARSAAGSALFALAPVTGRTHQIRVHSAHAGAALIGDRSYGGLVRLTLPSGRVIEPGRIALHAARVVVPNETNRPVVAASPVPLALRELWAALGGDGSAWELATSCALD
jgi:23S rRNA-/tRNA-specific pseudouridylate synthase